MRGRGLALLAPLLALTMPALACGAPAPVHLPGDAAVPSAMLLPPPGWARGDPGAVLAGGAAYRAGCEDPLAAAMLAAGAMVLALDAGVPGPTPGRLAEAVQVLREAFGAGQVVALWPPEPRAVPVAAPVCEVVFGALGRDGPPACRPPTRR